MDIDARCHLSEPGNYKLLRAAGTYGLETWGGCIREGGGMGMRTERQCLLRPRSRNLDSDVG